VAVNAAGTLVAHHGQTEHSKRQQVDYEQHRVGQEPVDWEGGDDQHAGYGQHQFIRVVGLGFGLEDPGEAPDEHALTGALTVMVMRAFGAEETIIEQDKTCCGHGKIYQQQTPGDRNQGIAGQDAGDEKEHGPVDKIGELMGGFHSAAVLHNIILSKPRYLARVQ